MSDYKPVGRDLPPLDAFTELESREVERLAEPEEADVTFAKLYAAEPMEPTD